MTKKRAYPALLIAASLATAPLLNGCLHDPVAERLGAQEASFDLLTRAQKLKAQGDFILAIDLLHEAARLSPRPVVYYEIASSNAALGKEQEASLYYERALEMAPDYALARAEYDLLKSEIGEPIVAAQRENRTAQESADVVPSSPDEPRLEDRASEEEEVRGSSDQADSPTDSTETRSSQSAPSNDSPAQRTSAPSGPFSGLTGALDRVSEVDEISDELTGVDAAEVREVIFPELQQDEDIDWEEQLAAAKEAEGLDRFQDSARILSRYLVAFPEDIDVRLEFAEALQRSGRTVRAEEEYLRAQALAPQNADVFFASGNFYAQIRRDDDALAAFRQALTIDSDHLRARNNLGALLIRMDSPEAALNEIDLVLAADQTFASAWLNKALALDDSGAPESEVIDALERYLRLNDLPDLKSETWLRTLREAP